MTGPIFGQSDFRPKAGARDWDSGDDVFCGEENVVRGPEPSCIAPPIGTTSPTSEADTRSPDRRVV